jgi:uncharacterized protein
MNTRRHVELTTALDQIIKTLIHDYHPEKIILFGSLAHGNIGEWSDIDLAIIKDTPLPFIKRLEEVALLCLAPVSIDYLVYTPAEFARMVAEQNYYITHEILDKGIVLYEQQPASAVA